MSKTSPKTNYSKWAFIVGTPIAVVGLLLTAATVPDLRCKLGIDATACNAQQKDVEFRVESEDSTPLANVKILVSAKGSPENATTDINGYAKVKVPSQGDAIVKLIKPGYPVQNIVINLATDQNIVRTIILSKSGNPEVKASNIPAESTPTSTPVKSEVADDNKSTLLESTCVSSTPGHSVENMFRKEEGKATFGREMVASIASIGMLGYPNNSISRTTNIEFVCGLNNSYKELKMVFGVHSADSLAQPANKIELEVFLNGKSAGKKIVAVGARQEFPLNVKGAQDISFKLSCLKDICPPLIFSEMSLR
jgi:hypothetical protein